MENEIKKIDKPYSDDDLFYNENTGRYQLTIAQVKSLVDVCPIKSDSVLERRSKDTARLVYNFIFSRCHTANKKLVNYLLNNTENGRNFLKEVMSIQMEADLMTGINSIGKLSTVNVQSGQIIDRNAMGINRLCVDCEEEIKQSQNYFCGINIIYQAPYPYNVYVFAGVK